MREQSYSAYCRFIPKTIACKQMLPRIKVHVGSEYFPGRIETRVSREEHAPRQEVPSTQKVMINLSSCEAPVGMDCSLSSVTFVDESDILFPDGKVRGLLDTMYQLSNILPISDSPSGSKIYKNSFTGQSAVDALKEKFMMSSEEAEFFGENLRRSDYLQHVVDPKKPFAANSALYRLTCHQHPDILNSFVVWPLGQQCENPILLTRKLLDQLDDIERRLKYDGQVFYKYACKSRLYHQFQVAVCELHVVNLRSMSNDVRTVSIVPHSTLCQFWLLNDLHHCRLSASTFSTSC